MMQRDDKFKETPKLQSNDLMALLHSGSFTYRVLANNCQVLIACLHPLTIHLQPDGSMSLDSGRKLEYPERTCARMGKTQKVKLHLNLAFCEAMVTKERKYCHEAVLHHQPQKNVTKCNENDQPTKGLIQRQCENQSD